MVPVLTTSRAGLPSTWTESLGALAIRASYRATNEIRASDQYDHGEGTRDHNPASPSGACRRGDRMKCHLAHLPARCADRPRSFSRLAPSRGRLLPSAVYRQCSSIRLIASPAERFELDFVWAENAL